MQKTESTRKLQGVNNVGRSALKVEVHRVDDERTGAPSFVPADVVQDARRAIVVKHGGIQVDITENDFEHRELYIGINAGCPDFDAGAYLPVATLDAIIVALTTARDKAQELGLLTPRALPKPFYLDQGSAAV